MERVLFVDDDPTVRRTFARVLRRQGFIVDLAETGERALQLATQYAYAVVVTDLWMQGLDGADLITQLKQIRPGSTYLLVTGANDARAATRIREIADDAEVIRKPWDNAELCDAIERGFASFIRHHADSAPPPSVPYGPRAVLLVEDSREDALVFQSGLLNVAPDEYRVRWAASLAQAKAALTEERFSVVLVDLELPDSHGVDTVRRLREVAPHTPLIVLTGSGDDALGMRAVELGAQDCLVKAEVAPALVHRAIRYALERKRSEDRIKYLARHDALTGVANRDLLSERLAQAISHGRRSGALTAVLFVDLDGFKAVNEQLGHEAGDQVLQQAAERLRSSVGETDTVARLGGDEFAILLEHLEHHSEATPVAERVISSFATPIEIGDEAVQVGASVGIAFAPENGETTDVLLQCASAAMYEAKEGGSRGYRYFDPEVHNRAVRRVKLEAELREAASQGQFTLHYQPLVRVATGQVQGFEALLRWNHPDGRVVAPADFVPALERAGQIAAVGAWVLRRACQQLADWKAAGLGESLRVAVNVSPLQLAQPEFIDLVRGVLEETRLAAECLELELGEAALHAHAADVAGPITSLSDLGVRVVVDDFCSGASHLPQLAELPLAGLKIDAPFVQGMLVESRRAVLVEAAVKLAQTLGLQTVGEGVESAAQLRRLAVLGCDAAQGFHVARPQAAAGLPGWLRGYSAA